MNDNTVINGAGGILNTGFLNLDGSAQVNHNTATGGASGYGLGGGIINNGTVVNLRGFAQVNDNTADSAGGIYNIVGTLNLDGSAQVNHNTATGLVAADDRFGYGGGIFVFEGPMSVVNLRGSAQVIGNVARYGGGIANFGTLNACNSTGLDQWTGVISPNTPDDPPTPTLIAC